MKKTKTNRGFTLVNFKDERENECSLQKSSNATEDCIWLGANEIKVTIGYPWTTYGEAEILKQFNGKDIVGNNRMHLTQKQVKKLLPHLQKFAETGEL